MEIIFVQIRGDVWDIWSSGPAGPTGYAATSQMYRKVGSNHRDYILHLENFFLIAGILAMGNLV
jgi:hypothetical protein